MLVRRERVVDLWSYRRYDMYLVEDGLPISESCRAPSPVGSRRRVQVVAERRRETSGTGTGGTALPVCESVRVSMQVPLQGVGSVG